jgi:hypothetical protein
MPSKPPPPPPPPFPLPPNPAPPPPPNTVMILPKVVLFPAVPATDPLPPNTEAPTTTCSVTPSNEAFMIASKKAPPPPPPPPALPAPALCAPPPPPPPAHAWITTSAFTPSALGLFHTPFEAKDCTSPETAPQATPEAWVLSAFNTCPFVPTASLTITDDDCPTSKSPLLNEVWPVPPLFALCTCPPPPDEAERKSPIIVPKVEASVPITASTCPNAEDTLLCRAECDGLLSLSVAAGRLKLEKVLGNAMLGWFCYVSPRLRSWLAHVRVLRRVCAVIERGGVVVRDVRLVILLLSHRIYVGVGLCARLRYICPRAHTRIQSPLPVSGWPGWAVGFPARA